MTEPAFNIFDALSAWGKSLPWWQRCLLAKLVSSSELSEDTVSAVFKEYLIDQGLEDAKGPRTPADMELPQFQAGTSRMVSPLATMAAVSGVNALAAGETLTFGPNLTVVYGPNGAGKSGYARVLKSACFTRSKDTGILGDVRLAKSKQPKPTATFTLADGTTATFVHQAPCPLLRDSFAVFDSTCIRVHLDERNAFRVMPYLFDVFPRMVEVFGTLQRKLREEIALRTPEADKYVIPESKSEIANILANLTDGTDLVRLKGLAEFGDTEKNRLAEIDKKLDELRTTDPQEIIKKNEQRIDDLSATKAALAALAASIDSGIVSDVTNTVMEFSALSEKAAALSAAQFGGEPVQPIGTRAWRELLAAAIAYSKEAYPNDTFPPKVDGARCVLCHQTLDDESAGRLGRFYQMATSDIETRLVNTRRRLTGHAGTLDKVNLAFFAQESAAHRTLHELDAALESEITAHIEGYRQVVNVLVRAVADASDPGLSLLQHDSVSKRLSTWVLRLQQDNEELRRGDPRTLIQTLSEEKQLLLDRGYLAGKYDEIAAAVAALKWVTKANACIRAFSVTQREVTSKQKALATELVARGFVTRFIANCEALQLALPVQFRFAGDSGTTDRKIEIANAEVGGISPSQILSEGEQTAAALADFLTEVELNGTCAGVIFDDPVTSMDHVRKESIAKRLVDEATRRQVIVFTHDILFTNYLAAAAKVNGVAFSGRTVWRDETSAPGAVDRLAFPHEYYEGQARDFAQKHLDVARTLTGDAQRDALEKACGSLRTAYEDFIQKKLFNNVVRRWRENITFTLDQVFFDEGIAARVHQRMEVLSRFIDAHSHSPEFHEVPLTVDAVASELTQFDGIKADYQRARSVWEKAKPKSASVYN